MDVAFAFTCCELLLVPQSAKGELFSCLKIYIYICFFFPIRYGMTLYVDKYTDSRPRFEIEVAGKIGFTLGAYFRVCEAASWKAGK